MGLLQQSLKMESRNRIPNDKSPSKVEKFTPIRQSSPFSHVSVPYHIQLHPWWESTAIFSMKASVIFNSTLGGASKGGAHVPDQLRNNCDLLLASDIASVRLRVKYNVE